MQNDHNVYLLKRLVINHLIDYRSNKGIEYKSKLTKGGE